MALVKKLKLISQGVGGLLGPYNPPYDPLTDADISVLGMFDAENADSYVLADGNITAFNSLAGGFSLTREIGTYVPAILEPTGWADGSPAFKFSAGAGLTGSVYSSSAGPTNATGMTAFIVAARGASQAAYTAGQSRVRPALVLPAIPDGANWEQAYIGVWASGADAAQNIFSAGNHSQSPANSASIAAFAAGDAAVFAAQLGLSSISLEKDSGQSASYAWNAIYGRKWALGGAYNSNDINFDGLIKLVIVVAGAALTQAQIDKLMGYCAWRAGLQGNLLETHPYKGDGPYSA